ncbi:hypothetical protein ACQ4M3_20395 [Leptolyngbya sp. AN03gr2]|uniref:hypothetical protein n=1 Tax=unclassified Leptolyngbya TaxID=2650499 RepID=UPI003D315090
MFSWKNAEYLRWLTRFLYVNLLLSLTMTVNLLIESPETVKVTSKSTEHHIRQINQKTDAALGLLLWIGTSAFGIRVCTVQLSYSEILEKLEISPDLSGFHLEESSLSIQSAYEIRRAILDSLQSAAEYTINREEADFLYLETYNLIPIDHSPKITTYLSHIILRISAGDKLDLLEHLQKQLGRCKEKEEIEMLVNKLWEEDIWNR